MSALKIIIERHPDGYVSYPLGLKGVVVGQGDTYDEALKDVRSAIEFHIETFGPEAFETVRDAVKAMGVEVASAEIAMIPQNYVKLTGNEAKQMLKLFEAIDDHDDVQHVWANFDIEEKEIEALA